MDCLGSPAFSRESPEADSPCPFKSISVSLRNQDQEVTERKPCFKELWPLDSPAGGDTAGNMDAGLTTDLT